LREEFKKKQLSRANRKAKAKAKEVVAAGNSERKGGEAKQQQADQIVDAVPAEVAEQHVVRTNISGELPLTIRDRRIPSHLLTEEVCLGQA
jgi:hypothetical protein